jgi:hypothetical protein
MELHVLTFGDLLQDVNQKHPCHQRSSSHCTFTHLQNTEASSNYGSNRTYKSLEDPDAPW